MKLTALILFLLLPNCIWAQNNNNRYNKYFAKDQLSFSLNATQWIKDKDVPSPTLFSRGINLQMMYPVIGNNWNVALALGFGLACQNYYLNKYIYTNNDSLWFEQIPDSINYSKYKLNTNYITLPVELRFRTNPNKASRNSFKIYPGFRAGIMVNVHTKYIGRDLEDNAKIKVKNFDISHVEQFDYGASLRIGYGKFMVHSYYSLSNLIENGKGSRITPFELGLTLILF